MLSPSSMQSLRRVFYSGFTAHDITEPLISCDPQASAQETLAFMEQRGLEIIGVRQDGLVVGYVERDELGRGTCGECITKIEGDETILDTTPLTDVVARLKTARRLFVSVFGQIGGIVTRTDLQKPPVRMWLFGMVTLIEMRMTHMIEMHESDTDWRQYMSEARIKKAEVLLEERRRRNQQLELIDCLQFGDKCQIVARDPKLRSWTRFDSRRQVEQAGKNIERLRNNLAHAQDIISSDWETVVDLTTSLDVLLEDDRTPS